MTNNNNNNHGIRLNGVVKPEVIGGGHFVQTMRAPQAANSGGLGVAGGGAGNGGASAGNGGVRQTPTVSVLLEIIKNLRST